MCLKKYKVVYYQQMLEITQVAKPGGPTCRCHYLQPNILAYVVGSKSNGKLVRTNQYGVFGVALYLVNLPGPSLNKRRKPGYKVGQL